MDDEIVFAFNAVGSDGKTYRVVSIHPFLDETKDYDELGTLVAENGDSVLGSDLYGWELNTVP
jgi:hypothetical protein